MARRSLLVLLAAGLAGGAGAAQQAPAAGCVTCHGAEAMAFRDGAHAAAGMDCASCHGGDQAAREQTAAHAGDFTSLKDALASVQSCGGCHSDVERMRAYGLRTDQLSLYWSSAHGQRLQEHGDPQVATCAGCHGPHAIRPVADPRSAVHPLRQVETCGRCHADAELMAAYDLDPGVVDAFRGSVHGTALLEDGQTSSPSCASCHGSHGATPPRVDQVGTVCGSCHATVHAFFSESGHAAAARRGEIEECVSCHGDHAVQHPEESMLISAGCKSCHQDAADPGLAAGAELFQGLTALEARIAAAERELRRAGAQGMFLHEGQSYLEEAQGMRLRARVAVHAFAPGALRETLATGDAMVEQTLRSLETERRRMRDRRVYAALFAGAVLFLGAGMLAYRRGIGA